MTRRSDFPAPGGSARAALPRLRRDRAEARVGARRDARLLRERLREPAPRRVRSCPCDATSRYHAARERVAKFVGVADPDTVIFTRGTTESLNLRRATHGVERTFELVMRLSSPADGASRQFRHLAAARARDRREVPHLRAHRRRPRRPRHAPSMLVTRRRRSSRSATYQMRSGPSIPCARSRRFARALGALIVMRRRAGRAAPARRFRLARRRLLCVQRRTRCCGPMGIGALVARRELLETMPPYQFGGDMIEFVGDETTHGTCCRTSSRRGRRTSADAVGLAAAVRLSRRDRDGRGARARARAGAPGARASSKRSKGSRYTARAPAQRSGVVSLHSRRHASARPGDDPRSSTASASAPVITAPSRSCARLGVSATARASFYVYNDRATSTRS